MTPTTAERTQAIHEIIKAIAEVQALISARVESPWCGTLAPMELGKTYTYLCEALTELVRGYRYSL